MWGLLLEDNSWYLDFQLNLIGKVTLKIEVKALPKYVF